METKEVTALQPRAPFVPVLFSALLAAIIAGTGTYSFMHAKQSAADKDLQAQITSLKTQLATTPSPSVSASGSTFSSSVINFSFKAPVGSQYAEQERLKDRIAAGLVVTGHKVTFADASRTYPGFEAVSTDFTVMDTIPQDILSGSFDNPSSVGISYLEDGAKKTQVEADVYRITGFSNMECGPGVDSYLVVAPPKNSGLKYVSFYLGGSADDLVGDPSVACTTTPNSIAKAIATLDSDSAVLAEQAKALDLIKTFSVR